MSPIFRHGRLRLYLLKLLDEAPRHGYEVIRLLQDRFMGVYSPSPGTIYPRLARLEEDGLVTHDEVDGRKVYRITEKGRDEIRARLDDLAELEEELTESVRDIAREVTEDVRDTVRSLREEITWAARDVRREGRGRGRDGAGQAPGADAPGDEASGQGEPASARPGSADDGSGTGTTAWHEGERGTAGHEAAEHGAAEHGAGSGRRRSEDARRIREEARQAREDIRDSFRSQRRGSQQGRGRAGGGRPGGARQDWGSWADRAASWQARGDRRPGGPGWGRWQDWGGMPGGLERMASDFARDLSSAAGHAGDIGEGALGDLRDILADTMARIRDEVFATPRDRDKGESEAADSEAAASDAEPAGHDAEPAGDDDAGHGEASDGPAGSAPGADR
ncbi:MAG TPA: helix-turn-helix transcriptional regulator [Streptosporangiaceae bacterium]|nr:helix-turn-helix transcriptional regulator [Streptosporangiaceae bacterium]